MPATLCSERGWKRKPISPVFFAPTDIQPGGLSEELQGRLRSSRHLIVICSPQSAQSEWVGREIAYFHSLGRQENIHFFIVDGMPHSGDVATECFNPAIEALGLPEILGVNVHERVYRWPWLNRERAYVQLITKLLGVEYDTLWRRHRRQLVSRAVAWLLGALMVLTALLMVWRNSQPIDVAVQITEESVPNPDLPPIQDAIVTLTLDKETKTDTVAGVGDAARFLHVPKHFIGQRVSLTVECANFHRIDTMLVLAQAHTIGLHRNESVFGNVCFGLWSLSREAMLPNRTVSVGDIEATADSNGIVTLFVPLSEQKQQYTVTADFPLADDVLVMPCDANQVIAAQ